MMLSDKGDSRVHEVMHFVAESDVYEYYSDDGTTEGVEASHTVELSYSVKCRDSQNDGSSCGFHEMTLVSHLICRCCYFLTGR